MRVFSLVNLVTSVVVGGGVVFTSYEPKEPVKSYLEHDVWIENLDAGSSDRIEIHNKKAPFFSAVFTSKGIGLSVPLANMPSGRPLSAGYNKQRRALHELNTRVTMGNGVEKRIECDMRTGEILRTLTIFPHGRRVEVFDGKGVFLETQELR
jgi:hypothetical protein